MTQRSSNHLDLVTKTLHCHCTATTLQLQLQLQLPLHCHCDCNCTPLQLPLRLHCNCTPLHCHCTVTATAPQLHCHCNCKCTATALQLPLQLPLHCRTGFRWCLIKCLVVKKIQDITFFFSKLNFHLSFLQFFWQSHSCKNAMAPPRHKLHLRDRQTCSRGRTAHAC